MESTIMKLFHLDLDKALPIIKPLYSTTGAPAKDQAAMIRSLFLMIELKEYSISQRAEKVANDKLYYDICGFQGKAPSHRLITILSTAYGSGLRTPKLLKTKVTLISIKPRKRLKQGQNSRLSIKGLKETSYESETRDSSTQPQRRSSTAVFLTPGR